MNRDGNTRLTRWPYWDKESRKEPEVPLDQSAIAALAVSPDGRLVATSEYFNRRYHASSTKPIPWPVIRIWEAATGKEVQRLEGFRSLSSKLAFSPDGRRLASALCNDTVLVWDVRRAARLEGTGKKLTQEVMDRLWGDLALADGARAYSAITAFQESPDEAVALLARRVRPVPAAEAARVQQLIRSLDSEMFMEREASARELKELTPRFRATLRKALEAPGSLEVKRRLEAILTEAPRQLPLELLRTVRSIQTLERIGSPEARRILGVLAEGAADAHETRAARMALDRLTMRSRSSGS
jgi:hypothetical protein